MIFAWLKRRAEARKQLILAILADDTEKYGLDLVNASNGRLHLGSLYVILGRMENEGLIVGRWGDTRDNPRRRLYRLKEPQ